MHLQKDPIGLGAKAMDWKVRLIFAILALTLINAYVNPGRKPIANTKDVCIALDGEEFKRCSDILSREWEGRSFQSSNKRTVQRAGERRE